MATQGIQTLWKILYAEGVQNTMVPHLCFASGDPI